MILGVPVLNRPDLFGKCVGSIDHPVHLVAIDNSPEGDWVGEIAMAYDGAVTVAQPAANLGFTASVNHVIRSFPREGRWFVANADTVFAPGDLARLDAATTGPVWTGIVDWRVFGLTGETVDRVGLWDENFFNYCSDADYEWRCHLAGVEQVRLPGLTGHVGSVSYQGDPRYAHQNARSYPRERAYYRAKWGGDLRGGEAFTTPFDAGGHLGDWRLDVSALRDTAWT